MLRAVEHVRPMRGGAQGHLIRADDNRYYVVKALNNPQHPLVLANEWLATGIARAIGLSVPECEVMDISDEFLARTPGLVIRYSGNIQPMAVGPAFASRLPTPTNECPIYDYLPELALEGVENLAEFAGMLALDKWLCNCDGRQVIFCRPVTRAKMRVFFIDFGFCFNAGDWTFPDAPLRGVYSRNAAYDAVTSWESFEPWLSRIEHFSEAGLLKLLAAMPIEWHHAKATLRLFETLLGRRALVRDLITKVRFSARAPFTHWTAADYAPVQPPLFAPA